MTENETPQQAAERLLPCNCDAGHAPIPAVHQKWCLYYSRLGVAAELEKRDEDYAALSATTSDFAAQLAEARNLNDQLMADMNNRGSELLVAKESLAEFRREFKQRVETYDKAIAEARQEIERLKAEGETMDAAIQGFRQNYINANFDKEAALNTMHAALAERDRLRAELAAQKQNIERAALEREELKRTYDKTVSRLEMELAARPSRGSARGMRR